VCSRAVIIAKGRLLADSTPAKLAARSRYHNAVRLRIASGSVAKIRADLDRLVDVDAVEAVTDDEEPGTLLVIAREGRPIAEDIAEMARARRWRLTSMTVERGRLDDVFRAITVPDEPRALWDFSNLSH